MAQGRPQTNAQGRGARARLAAAQTASRSYAALVDFVDAGRDPGAAPTLHPFTVGAPLGSGYAASRFPGLSALTQNRAALAAWPATVHQSAPSTHARESDRERGRFTVLGDRLGRDRRAVDAFGSAARACLLRLGVRASPWELGVALTGLLYGRPRDPPGF